MSEIKKVVKGLDYTFFQRRQTYGQQAHERCSTSQINAKKVTMRYHFLPVRMAIIKKARNDKYW